MPKETFTGLERAIKNKNARIKRNKIKYEELKKLGLCMWCKIRKAEPHHVRCKICQDRIKEKCQKKN